MEIPGLNVVTYKIDPYSRSEVEDEKYSLIFAGPRDTIDVTLTSHIISISSPDNGSYLEVKILPKYKYHIRLEEAYRLFKQKLFGDEYAVEQDQVVSRASYRSFFVRFRKPIASRKAIRISANGRCYSL